ncbi:hypothetical protein AB0M95_26585 [Sphaerisporangium sp. NPDC051017]|uniref:hypothetical protein n=1 Tax=Sphaerisporangium sp. NPDC051017 TaxID=3154636 RepID=UPI003439206C
MFASIGRCKGGGVHMSEDVWNELIPEGSHHVFYWFLPLPDYLAIPHATVTSFTYAHNMIDAIERLHSEGRCGEDVQLSVDSLHVSLRFWQERVQEYNPYDLDATFKVAKKAFPYDGNQTGDDTAGSLDRDVTVVEAAVIFEANLEPDEEALSDAFDKVIECIQRVQRAYNVITKEPVKIATRELLPFMVPMAHRLVNQADESWPDGLSAYMVNMGSIFGMRRYEDLDEEQLSALHIAIDREVSAFMAYADLRRQSGVALERLGDYRGAVLAAATAAEVLLDDLLMHLMWEEGMRPEDACGTFANERAGITRRVKVEYAGRIGGLWSLKDPGAISDWANKIASLRNRVIHGGHVPTLGEAREAEKCLNRLEEFIVNLLCSPPLVAKYPRTATALAGKRIEKQGLSTRRIRDLLENPEEPNWVETFARWRAATWRLAEESEQAEPDVNNADLLLVVHPDGADEWVLHDRATHKAARTNEAWSMLPEGQAASVRQVRDDLSRHQYKDAQCVAIIGVAGLRPVEDWVEQHRRIPMLGVMVNRIDHY